MSYTTYVLTCYRDSQELEHYIFILHNKLATKYGLDVVPV